MKTAVSIPDALFRRAERLAQRTGRSRSAIYRDALAEYVDRREPGAITMALDEIVEALGPGVDDWVAEAGRSTLERNEWWSARVTSWGVAARSNGFGTGIPPPTCPRSSPSTARS